MPGIGKACSRGSNARHRLYAAHGLKARCSSAFWLCCLPFCLSQSEAQSLAGAFADLIRADAGNVVHVMNAKPGETSEETAARLGESLEFLAEHAEVLVYRVRPRA